MKTLRIVLICAAVLINLSACGGDKEILAAPSANITLSNTALKNKYIESVIAFDDEMTAQIETLLVEQGIRADEYFKINEYINYMKEIEYSGYTELRQKLGLPDECIFYDFYDVMVFPQGNPMPVFDLAEMHLYDVDSLYAIYVPEEDGD